MKNRTANTTPVVWKVPSSKALPVIFEVHERPLIWVVVLFFRYQKVPLGRNVGVGPDFLLSQYCQVIAEKTFNSANGLTF